MRTERDLAALDARLQRQLADIRVEVAAALASAEDRQKQLRSGLAEVLARVRQEVAGLRLHVGQEVEALASQLNRDLQESDRNQSKVREEGLQSVFAELASVREELLAESTSLQRALSVSAEAAGKELDLRIRRVQGKIAAAAGSIDSVEAQLLKVEEAGKQSWLLVQEDMEKIRTATMEDIAGRLEAVRKDKESLLKKMEDVRSAVLADLNSIQAAQAKATADAQDSMRDIEQGLIEKITNSEKSIQTVEQGLVSRIDDSNQVLYHTNVLNYRLAHSHSRLLAAADLHKFEEHWLPVLKLDLSRKALGYIAHKICSLEDRCAGRLAASVQDAVLRVLLARSLGGKPLRLLEIGSLFGIALASVYENCRGFHTSSKLVAVDPMDGFYMAGNDKISGMPVAADLFHHNMQMAAVPKSDYQLVQHLSTDKQALGQLKNHQFDILVIDGDHSYAGVQFDFDTFSPLVRHGGLVLIDDYAQKHWPEVTRFVDEKVKGRRGWKLVGADWHSIVFKRTGGRSRKKTAG